MNRITATFFGILLAASLCGCNSRDKEEVAKKTDGTETFQYDASAVQTAGSEPAGAAAQQSQPAPAAKPAGKHDGFKYQPNPKYFPSSKEKAVN